VRRELLSSALLEMAGTERELREYPDNFVWSHLLGPGLLDPIAKLTFESSH
jgi:hypothetical protein